MSVEKQSIEQLFKKEIGFVEHHLPHYFPHDGSFLSKGTAELNESVNYSLLSGGKRFRPLLSLLTAEALGKPFETVLPVCAAIEFIHTYSLIHDDLPAIDNDEYRRGKPSNHVVYGEATALLAGDALLTEAFGVLAKGYQDQPKVAVEIVSLISKASGIRGMVGGQALDMEVTTTNGPPLELMKKIHELKTGSLIKASCEASAVACGACSEEINALTSFAEKLGLAFQLADDLLDYEPSNPERTSYVNLAGVEATKDSLKNITELAIVALECFGDRANKLRVLADFNQKRVDEIGSMACEI